MMQIREVWTNQTEGYRFGDSGWYEPFTDNRKHLFRSLQKEYGRCLSRVYHDTPDGQPDAIGWYFEKTRQYTDAKENYRAGTWVFIREVKDDI